jgi:hypothetical protein
MQLAVVTFDGFNELDSFIASALINQCRKEGLEAFITTPTPVVTSLNGVEVSGQRPMDFVTERRKRPPGDLPYGGRHQRRRSQEAVARSKNPFGGLVKYGGSRFIRFSRPRVL